MLLGYLFVTSSISRFLHFLPFPNIPAFLFYKIHTFLSLSLSLPHLLSSFFHTCMINLLYISPFLPTFLLNFISFCRCLHAGFSFPPHHLSLRMVLQQSSELGSLRWKTQCFKGQKWMMRVFGGCSHTKISAQYSAFQFYMHNTKSWSKNPKVISKSPSESFNIHGTSSLFNLKM